MPFEATANSNPSQSLPASDGEFIVPRKPLPPQTEDVPATTTGTATATAAAAAAATNPEIPSDPPPPYKLSLKDRLRGFFVPLSATAAASSQGRICGLRRGYFYAAVVAGVVAAGLIVGLSVGLTQHKSSQSSSSGTITGAQHTGDLTYFTPSVGACGYTNTVSDHIVAISISLFDSFSVGANPNLNRACGKKIRATRGGKSVDVKVVDRCGACAKWDLDMANSAYDVLADEAAGRVSVSWHWLTSN
ncbi:MAG: hypothetical protein M1834_006240 [Cirrosporium novae-zelandiae]|nr:MAG: hypothetical protein M1834_006240 [Cirrosporium novae-zelandiae]